MGLPGTWLGTMGSLNLIWMSPADLAWDAQGKALAFTAGFSPPSRAMRRGCAGWTELGAACCGYPSACWKDEERRLSSCPVLLPSAILPWP